ncbi:hypothetical protein [Streptomyces sp. NPDC059957]|uniref:hypothetical protein n=1 Tax=Streptomyces sp. NPDC059957 TaxID=3347016 RepID=UPI0036503F07
MRTEVDWRAIRRAGPARPARRPGVGHQGWGPGGREAMGRIAEASRTSATFFCAALPDP